MYKNVVENFNQSKYSLYIGIDTSVLILFLILEVLIIFILYL